MPKKSLSGQSWDGRWSKILKPGNQIITRPQKFLSTGSPSLDIGLQGGFPVGHIVRVYGKKGMCKTTLSQRCAARAMLDNINVYWLDTESAFEPTIAAANGIDLDSDKFMVWSFDPTEELSLSFETMSHFFDDMMVDKKRNPNGSLFIVDSWSALRTAAHLAGNIEDSIMAKVAQLSAIYFPKLCAMLKKTDSTLLCLQQQRAVIGGMGYETESPGGGYALQHYAYTEIKLQNAGKEEHGYRVKFNIVANKTAHGGVVGEFYFDNRYGIDTARELIDLSVDVDLIKKGGAWYTSDLFGESVRFQGADNFTAWLYEHPEYLSVLEKAVMTKYMNKTGGVKPDVGIDEPIDEGYNQTMFTDER